MASQKLSIGSFGSKLRRTSYEGQRHAILRNSAVKHKNGHSSNHMASQKLSTAPFGSKFKPVSMYTISVYTNPRVLHFVSVNRHTWASISVSQTLLCIALRFRLSSKFKPVSMYTQNRKHKTNAENSPEEMHTEEEPLHFLVYHIRGSCFGL